MRKGWKQVKIFDIIEPLTTVDPRKKPQESFEYIDVSSVSRKTLSVHETKILLGRNAPSRARRLVHSGDVLFATIRPTLQRIARIPDQLDGSVCSTGYFVLRPKPGLSSGFLFHYLFSTSFSHEMASLQRGASYPAVSDTDVKNHLMYLPPLPEQKRIVEILDEAFAAIDKAIANTKKNIQNAEELGFRFSQETYSDLQSCWPSKRLDAIALVISGQHINSNKYNTEMKGLGYLTGPSDFGRKHPIVGKWTENPKRTAIYNDILITVKGSGVGKVNLLDQKEVAISRQLMAIRSEMVRRDFLYTYMTLQYGYFQARANGAAIPGISRTDVLTLLVPVPPIEIQIKTEQQVHDLSLRVDVLQKNYINETQNLEFLKQSILHKAFTGELTSDFNAVDKSLSEAGV